MTNIFDFTHTWVQLSKLTHKINCILCVLFRRYLNVQIFFTEVYLNAPAGILTVSIYCYALLLHHWQAMFCCFVNAEILSGRAEEAEGGIIVLFTAVKSTIQENYPPTPNNFLLYLTDIGLFEPYFFFFEPLYGLFYFFVLL